VCVCVICVCLSVFVCVCACVVCVCVCVCVRARASCYPREEERSECALPDGVAMTRKDFVSYQALQKATQPPKSNSTTTLPPSSVPL
jgi:hypothetical protein